MQVPSPIAPSDPSKLALANTNGGNPSPSAFGAGIGAGLGALSEGVGQFGAFMQKRADAAVRVNTLRSFADFQTQVNDTVSKMQQEAPLNDTEFTSKVRNVYTDLSNKWLATVPPQLQEEFGARVGELGVGVASESTKFQIGLTDAFFGKAIDDQYAAVSTALGQDPSPENLAQQKARLLEVIDSSQINAIKKTSLKQQLLPGLEKIVYKQQWIDNATNEAMGISGATPLAVDLIKTFDGGTDEEAGKVASAAEDVARSAVGSDQWAALPSRARGALISVVADVGALPATVQDAIKTGDLVAVAQSIAKLGGDRSTAEAKAVLDVTNDSKIDSSPLFQNIPYEDRIALKADAEREVAQKLAATKAMDTAQQNSMVNALLSSLYDGKAGLNEIEHARQQGWLTDINDIAKAHEIYDKRNAELTLKRTALDKLAAGTTFDPTDENDKKALNAVIGQSGLQAIQNLDSNFAAAVVVPTVRRAQDIPTDVAGTLSGMIRSKDQKTALWAFDLLSQLQAASPKAFIQRTDDRTASDVEFWRNRKDYYPADELLATINRGTTPEEVQQDTLLRQKARDILANPEILAPGMQSVADRLQKVQSDMQASFGYTGGFMGMGAQPAALPQVPWVMSALSSDFSTMFQDEYVKYGDPKEAETAAMKDLARVWGVSTVNGTATIMKFPPETFYPAIGGDHSWMEKQLRDEGIIQPDEGFQLVSDQQTQADIDAMKKGGPPPSYMLVRIRDGQPHVIQGMDGYPMRQSFAVGDAEKALDRAWNQARKALFTEDDLARSLGLAQDHSLNTGVPVPEDAYGIRDYFMGGN